MAGKEKNKEWNLYVLRYNFSGNYYVGTTIDFERRMQEHWRRTSIKSDLPIWSEKTNQQKVLNIIGSKWKREVLNKEKQNIVKKI